MRIISFIEKLELIEQILRHLGLWDIRNHDTAGIRYFRLAAFK